MATTPADPNRLNGLISDLLLRQPPTAERPAAMPSDADWIRQAFIIPTDKTSQLPLMDPDDVKNRKFSSASLKYTDASLGGNIPINPPPQFTRYADIHNKGIRFEGQDVSLLPAGGNIGMGRYYSEAIDDNSQVIHLRFGVAQYNSLFQFFTGFYSSDAGSAARAGRFTQGFVDSFLRFGGQVIALAIAPLAIVPLAILMFGTAARFFMGWPSSKFYSLKPSMPLYWSAVTSLANQIGVNQGVINYFEETQKQNIMGKEHQFGAIEKSIFSDLLPNGFTKSGTIDVKSIASEAKRREMHYENALAKRFEDANGQDFFGIVKQHYGDVGNLKTLPRMEPHTSLEAYIQRFIDFPFFSKADGVNGGIEKDVRYPATSEDTAGTLEAASGAEYRSLADKTKVSEYVLANAADGSEWASFRVDYTGPVNESFNSTVAESSMAQKLNSISSSKRDLRMNLSGGAIGGVIDGIGTVLSQVGSTLHLEGLAAVAGSAFVDIPKHWDTSSASLPKSTYTFTLISPYGNPVSQMFSIYIPLAMILGGALPLATGKQSYTSPFLCELHDRGRCMTRLGIIDSLSITRGTSNLGFNHEGKAMAVDVSFTVLDLSSIMAMPIQPGFSLMPAAGLFDGENAFTDYLMAISGMKLRDTVDRFPMLKNQGKRILANVERAFSASSIGMEIASLPGVNMLDAIMRGTGKE